MYRLMLIPLMLMLAGCGDTGELTGKSPDQIDQEFHTAILQERARASTAGTYAQDRYDIDRREALHRADEFERKVEVLGAAYSR